MASSTSALVTSKLKAVAAVKSSPQTDFVVRALSMLKFYALLKTKAATPEKVRSSELDFTA